MGHFSADFMLTPPRIYVIYFFLLHARRKAKVGVVEVVD
jgi:hypothetical protein